LFTFVLSFTFNILFTNWLQPFDPEVIAEEYWKLHIARSNWVSELKFTGAIINYRHI
jgi:hypothetical protein